MSREDSVLHILREDEKEAHAENDGCQTQADSCDASYLYCSVVTNYLGVAGRSAISSSGFDAPLSRFWIPFLECSSNRSS